MLHMRMKWLEHQVPERATEGLACVRKVLHKVGGERDAGQLAAEAFALATSNPYQHLPQLRPSPRAPSEETSSKIFRTPTFKERRIVCPSTASH